METRKVDTLGWIRLLYGDPMTVFSSCVRSMITAPLNKTLDVCDYAAIEARVLFWFARHERGIKDFNNDVDSYVDLATRIYQKPKDKITKEMRFVGKQAFLGSGYGMGAPKFQKTCENLGQPVSEEIAQAAITAYRTVHAPVVTLWRNIELAAIHAVRFRGKRYTINRTTWWADKTFLWCLLPAGRKIAFFNPQVKQEPTRWGEMKPTLSYWGVDPLSKKWVKRSTFGGKLVENVVSGTSRDLMADAMLKIEQTTKSKIVLSVHDELVGERSQSEGSFEDFKKAMLSLPKWGEGIPMKVEGWSDFRYRK